MKNLMRCECCGEKKLVEKYEFTILFKSKDMIKAIEEKVNDVLCDDCAKIFGDSVKKISETYRCDGCGEEVSFYQINRVPQLTHNNDYDWAGYCDSCFVRAEDQEERIMSGMDL